MYCTLQYSELRLHTLLIGLVTFSSCFVYKHTHLLATQWTRNCSYFSFVVSLALAFICKQTTSISHQPLISKWRSLSCVLAVTKYNVHFRTQEKCFWHFLECSQVPRVFYQSLIHGLGFCTLLLDSIRQKTIAVNTLFLCFIFW